MRLDTKLRQLRSLYEETGNSLFAWKAFLVCKEENSELPGWVSEYLGSVAHDLTEGDFDPSNRRWAQEVLRLNPGKGKASRFDEYMDYAFEVAVAEDIAIELAAKKGLIPDEDGQYRESKDRPVEETAIRDVVAAWNKDKRYPAITEGKARHWYRKYVEGDAKENFKRLEHERDQASASSDE